MQRIYAIKHKKIVRTPGNLLKIHERSKRVKPKICALCKSKISGVAAKPKSKLAALSKSNKTVSRIYGGYLCVNCLSKLLKSKVRSGVSQ